MSRLGPTLDFPSERLSHITEKSPRAPEGRALERQLRAVGADPSISQGTQRTCQVAQPLRRRAGPAVLEESEESACIPSLFT